MVPKEVSALGGLQSDSVLERFWRRRKDDEGFTLIELIVVVLMIGILIAIALPTFLGARQRAQDKAVQSNLRNALAAAKRHFAAGGTYTGWNTGCAAGADTCTVADGIEPSLTWDNAGTFVGNVGITGVGAAPGFTVTMQATSASGTMFCIADNSAAGTPPGTVYGRGAAATYAACDALADW